MRPRIPAQPSHGGNGSFAAMAQGVALWLAVLTVFISAAPIWSFSNELAERFFYYEFGSEITYYLSFPMAFFIAMIVLYFARMSLGSSAMVIAFWVMSKLPIF